jgi:hypothetical protein
MFQAHVLSVSSVFIRMLQMFHLGVSKVNLVFAMLQWRRSLADSDLS